MPRSPPAERRERAAGRPHRPGARELLEGVLDAGTFVSWDEAPLDVAEPGSAYAAELAAAAERAGTDEAIITGEGRIHGHRVAVVVGEFRFLAGSIGGPPPSASRWPSSAPPASACRSSPRRHPGALGCRRAHRHS